MKSRRQSGRGGAAAGAMAVDGTHTHTTSSGCKMERKDVEKNRRLHMKGLCLKLSSLLPASSHLRHSSSSSSPPSSNKAALSGTGTAGCSSSVTAGDYKGAASSATTALPVIEVRHQDGTLDVALASEAGRPFRLHEVMAVLEQEGAEVVSASFSVVGDKIFYTLHSQALCPRVGLEAGRVAHQLRVFDAAATVSSLLT